MTKVHVKAGEYVGQSLGGKRHGKGSYSVCSPEPLPSLLDPVRVTCREDPRSKARWVVAVVQEAPYPVHRRAPTRQTAILTACQDCTSALYTGPCPQQSAGFGSSDC
jgi:hypothetical protein